MIYLLKSFRVHELVSNPEMVFLANFGVNLHVCLCGDLQVASAQTLDFLDIGQKSSFPDWKLSPTGKSFPDGHELAFTLRSQVFQVMDSGKAQSRLTSQIWRSRLVT